ncbi:MAG: hypothetical protein MMC23_009223 [Stictis urceolatum]|nr:hypothetical protein [Stictis urceolata]
MSQRAPLKYNALPPGYTRLLRVLSPAPSLRCEIQEYATDDLPEYLALSYAWGTGQATESVSCGEQALQVTPNLYAALHEIGMKEEFANQCIWIDAICIDQSNGDEKAVEVKRMEVVFAQAQRVVIWLGPAAEDSDLAMYELEELRNIRSATSKNVKIEKNTRAELRLANHPVWPAIFKLYNRPWFHRLWVVQEIILAKDLTVLCGGRLLSWAAMVSFATALMSANSQVLVHHIQKLGRAAEIMTSCITLENLRHNRSSWFNLESFVYTLVVTRGREATNPLDHIYGLLGLASENLRKLITVDYTLTVAECYTRVCKIIIQLEPALWLLTMSSSEHRDPELPSWCPDLSSRSNETTAYAFYAGFKAGFLHQAVRRSRVEVFDDDRAIRVPGFRVDMVKNVAQMCLEDMAHELETSRSGLASQRWELECLRLVQEVSPALGDISEAYYRALIAGHFDPNTPVHLNKSLEQEYFNSRQSWSDVDRLVGSVFSSSATTDPPARYTRAIWTQRRYKFFNTEGGRLGLGPGSIRSGDVVCVFYSAAPLFTLRFDPLNGKATLIGCTYIDGLMDLDTMPEEVRGADEMFCII